MKYLKKYTRICTYIEKTITKIVKDVFKRDFINK